MEMVLGLLIVIYLGQAGAVQEEMFIRRRDCSHFLFTDNIVFETDVFSELSCARLCVNHPSCVSFTTTPGPSSTCRGHAGLVTSTSAKLASPGAVTYTAQDDGSATAVTSEDTTVEGVASVESSVTTTDGSSVDYVALGVTTAYSDVSAWMGTECIIDDDCTAHHSQCYQNRCLCSPGHYFSVSSDCCVGSCAKHDLGTRFTAYVDGYVPTSFISSQLFLGEQKCFDFCVSFADCRAIDYRPAGGACYPLANTAAERGWSPGSGGDMVHYQRFCA